MTKTKHHILKSGFLGSKPISFIKKTFRGIYQLFPEKHISLKDFNQVIYHFHKNKQIRLYQSLLYSDDIMKLRQKEKNYKIHWKQGGLFDKGKEIMYFHFQLSKYEKSFCIYESGKEEFELAVNL
jgi:hypothetical protein